MFIEIPQHQMIHYKPLILEYSNSLNEKFIELLLDNEKNKILIYNLDHQLKHENTIGFIIFTSSFLNHENRFYLLTMAIHHEFQNMGYGSLLLQDFIIFLKDKYIKQSIQSKPNKIILHSTNNNISFYEKNNFVRNNQHHLYKTLYHYEKFNKDDTIMIYLFL